MSRQLDDDSTDKKYLSQINEALNYPLISNILNKLSKNFPEENPQCINSEIICNSAEAKTTSVAETMPTLYNQYPENSHNETLFGEDKFDNLTFNSSMNQVCI